MGWVNDGKKYIILSIDSSLEIKINALHVVRI